MRCALQIDVGFGDAVTPEPPAVLFPVLLDDLAAPTLKVYPVCTAIAGNYHAMVIPVLANNRMMGFFDITTIARRTELETGLGVCGGPGIRGATQPRGCAPQWPARIRPWLSTRAFGDDHDRRPRLLLLA